jgi:NADH-quinone oxidoreductase subunit M
MTMLLIVLFLPLLGFFLLLALPKGSKAASPVARAISLLTFVLSLGLIGAVYKSPITFSNVIDVPWVDLAGIRFHLGVDGISLWLIVLTTLLVPVGVWISQELIAERLKTFLSLILLFEFGLIGVFAAVDLFVFYVFWEVALIPMYLMVGGWGGAKRMYASVKFFVITFLGSVMMLVGIIYLYTRAGTFDYTQILTALNSGRLILSSDEQLFLFLAFFFAFAIKVPIFPFHTWQPLTYAEAPAPATFLLAAGMSKMGAYGLLRYCLPLFPNAAHRCASWIAVLAIIGIVYGALIAIVQPNIKRLIAYSSISHLGFVVLGIFTFELAGVDGAVYQMVAHGISTGALFVLAGYMEKRRGSMEIADFGGIATPAPQLAAVFMIAALASIGLPVLSNFVGEYLVLQGAAIANFSWAVWAALGVILSSAYMLWMYQRTFQGKAVNGNATMPDLSLSEWAPMILLLIPMVWLGTYTQTFLPSITAADKNLLDQTRITAEFRVQNRHAGSILEPNTRVLPRVFLSDTDRSRLPSAAPLRFEPVKESR